MLTRLIWPLLIVVAVVLAVVVSAAGEETRVELDYLGRIHAQSSDLAKSGDALRDVISRLQRIDRNEFVSVIDGIVQDLDAGLALTEGDTPIPSLVSVHALYREALETWETGLGVFSEGILAAADDPENPTVVDTVAEGLAEIRAGDRAYARMVAAMGREDIPEPLAPMPAVTLMPSAGRLLSLADSYVDSARSQNSQLGLRPGLGVSQLLSEPEWQVNPENQAVMPATTSATFMVVVSNVGNIRSEVVPLVLELIGGPEPLRLTEDIGPLEPEQQVTVVFDPFEVQPGGIYEIRATLAVTGNDSSFVDNEISVEFRVNEE